MNSVVNRGRHPALRAFAKALALSNIARFLPKSLQARMVAWSDVFDNEWFGRHMGSSDRLSAARHFVLRDDLGNAASPLFNADWYRNRYGLKGTPAEALLHYVLVGDRLGLRPHPWFDAKFFRKHYGVGQSARTALGTFLRNWRAMPIGHPLFDADWYRSTYVDVSLADVNPLVHFVECGIAEGRQPNAFFDPSWYLKQNPDVGASGLSAVTHYCVYGTQEGRNPGPEFDSRRYVLRNAKQGLLGLDPLSHYLTIGRSHGALIEGRALNVSDLVSDRAWVAHPPVGPIDVVIPVYRGIEETRACIESVLASRNQCRLRLRLHNDASPEPELGAYLRAVAQTHAEVLLVENSANLGFVGTVNDAMRRAMDCDDFQAVVLLNSDTEVSADWLDRLVAHADASANRVATVTALSNNATICSFPKLGANEMPPGFTTAQVDALAAKVNAGMAVPVPTGVGFCMLITKDALTEVGLFDEDAFGRGYGEENDFCMRALRHGYKNLLALDVFVRHVGEVSFADVSKPGKVNADRIIRERYPDYHSQIGTFCAEDPSFVARLRLTFALWRTAGRPVRALVTHTLGGGTERHVQEAISVCRSEGPVVVLRPVQGHPSRVRIENPSDFDGFDIEVDGLDGAGFAQLLVTMGVGAVQIHHILGHSDFVRDGLARARIPYDFVVHDYYSICPQITLSTPDDRYCGEPRPDACDACIAGRPTHGAADIRNWRRANDWLVLGAEHVRAPSHDAAARIQRYFGVTPDVCYHEGQVQADTIPERHGRWRRGIGRSTCRVLIIGALARHKGRNTVLEAVEAAKKLNLPLAFHLVGDTQGDIPAKLRDRLTWTGWYDEAELPRLIGEADADAILFASPIPETYSYTLTAAMRSGLPIVATQIGAFPERLQGYPSKLLVPPDIRGDVLARRVLDFVSELSERETVS